MSITVNLYYTGKNGNARRFAEEMTSSGLVDAIRAEDGNERYEYFLPILSDDSFEFLEEEELPSEYQPAATSLVYEDEVEDDDGEDIIWSI